MPYHSPHKFRHGFSVYALKNAKDIPTLKAISQNLMHSSLAITDGTYAILSDLDVKEQIAMLGQETSSNKKQILAMLKDFIKELENTPK